MKTFLSNLKPVIQHLIRNLYKCHPERSEGSRTNVRLKQIQRFLSFDKLRIGMTTVILSLFLAVILACPESALAVTKTWSGGASGEWNSSGNWSPAGIPSSSDDVTIDNAAVTATTTTINFSTLTIGSGTNTSSLTLTTNIGTGGSITINNAVTITQNNADSIEHPRQSRDKVQQTITEIPYNIRKHREL